MTEQATMEINWLAGEIRQPRQMLGDQTYDGHLSIHDDAMAEDLGFAGAPIEGPSHFSQFVPLLHEVFGDAWFERGCISAHYQNMVVEGESVRAKVQRPEPGQTLICIAAEKADGTSVLMGTASIGPDYGETELDQRRARLRPSEQLVILSELHVGQLGAANPEAASMPYDQHMGDMYPFSLQQKLQRSPFRRQVACLNRCCVSGFRSQVVCCWPRNSLRPALGCRPSPPSLPIRGLWLTQFLVASPGLPWRRWS